MNGTKILPEEFSIEFSSVMASGRVEEVRGTEEKLACLATVAGKYSGFDAVEYAARAVDRVRVFRLRLTEISGKRLVREGKPGMGYKG